MIAYIFLPGWKMLSVFDRITIFQCFTSGKSEHTLFLHFETLIVKNYELTAEDMTQLKSDELILNLAINLQDSKIDSLRAKAKNTDLKKLALKFLEEL